LRTFHFIIPPLSQSLASLCGRLLLYLIITEHSVLNSCVPLRPFAYLPFLLFYHYHKSLRPSAAVCLFSSPLFPHFGQFFTSLCGHLCCFAFLILIISTNSCVPLRPFACLALYYASISINSCVPLRPLASFSTCSCPKALTQISQKFS